MACWLLSPQDSSMVFCARRDSEHHSHDSRIPIYRLVPRTSHHIVLCEIGKIPKGHIRFRDRVHMAFVLRQDLHPGGFDLRHPLEAVVQLRLMVGARGRYRGVSFHALDDFLQQCVMVGIGTALAGALEAVRIELLLAHGCRFVKVAVCNKDLFAFFDISNCAELRRK